MPAGSAEATHKKKAAQTTGSTGQTGATTTTGGTVYFPTLSAGSGLPGSSTCAERVRASTGTGEVRPENSGANYTTGAGTSVQIDGASGAFNSSHAALIKGDFTGTTHQVLRWSACKWGLDEDIVKARAVAESTWRQSVQGDQTYDAAFCQLIGKSSPCYQSYGILQVKERYHKGTYPTSERSTPFNADYANAWQRACLEGAMPWLGNYSPSGVAYRPGDVWGCVGAWYSGQWYDSGAEDYIARVKGELAKRRWELFGF